jgi:hypothetical protein
VTDIIASKLGGEVKIINAKEAKITDIDIDNEIINNYFEFRYSSFILLNNLSSDCYILILEVSNPLPFINAFFEKYKTKSKFTLCTNYNIMCFENKILELFNNNEYIFTDLNKNCIWFDLKECSMSVQSVMATRLAFHIQMSLTNYGFYCLHGGATTFQGDSECGMLLFGNSGSGKTSIILKLIENGEKTVADDNIFLSIQNENGLAALKNTQNIGVDFNNLNTNFSYLTPYAAKSPLESFADKMRIDLCKYNSNIYLNSLSPKYVIYLDSNSNGVLCAEHLDLESGITLCLKNMMAYSNLYIDRFFDILFTINLSCSRIKLSPSKNLNETVKFLYSFIHNNEI